MSALGDIESAILAEVLTSAATAVAGLSPAVTVRSWRDQTAAAVFPALLVHVSPAVPAAENTALDAILWTALVNLAAQTHVEETPPASGATPIAADPDGSHCRAIAAAARDQIMAGFPTVDGLTALDVRIESAEDSPAGPINQIGFRVQLTFQRTEV